MQRFEFFEIVCIVWYQVGYLNLILVDGGWSDWTNSSSCSVTCGSFPGIMEQTRTCDNPLQVGAGLPCDGDPVQNISCTNDDPCPGTYILQYICDDSCGFPYLNHSWFFMMPTKINCAPFMLSNHRSQNKDFSLVWQDTKVELSRKKDNIYVLYTQGQPMVALEHGRTLVAVVVWPVAVAPGQRSAFVTLRRQQMAGSTVQGILCDSLNVTTSHAHVSIKIIDKNIRRQ